MLYVSLFRYLICFSFFSKLFLYFFLMFTNLFFFLTCRQDASDLSGPIQRYCYTRVILFLPFCLLPLLLLPPAWSSVRHAVYLQAAGQRPDCWPLQWSGIGGVVGWGNVEGQGTDETRWRAKRAREIKGVEKREIGKGRCDTAQIYGRGGSLN